MTIAAESTALSSVCGHCGNPRLVKNAYEDYWECLPCGWTTEMATREEREAVQARTAGHGRVFWPYSREMTGDRAEEINAEIVHERALAQRRRTYRRNREKQRAMSSRARRNVVFSQEKIAAWWHDCSNTWLGWSVEEPIKIELTVVYRPPVHGRKDLRRKPMVICEQVVFDPGVAVWPTTRKFWEAVNRRFEQQTGFKLRRLHQWVAENSP